MENEKLTNVFVTTRSYHVPKSWRFKNTVYKQSNDVVHVV